MGVGERMRSMAQLAICGVPCVDLLYHTLDASGIERDGALDDSALGVAVGGCVLLQPKYDSV